MYSAKQLTALHYKRRDWWYHTQTHEIQIHSHGQDTNSPHTTFSPDTQIAHHTLASTPVLTPAPVPVSQYHNTTSPQQHSTLIPQFFSTIVPVEVPALNLIQTVSHAPTTQTTPARKKLRKQVAIKSSYTEIEIKAEPRLPMYTERELKDLYHTRQDSNKQAYKRKRPADTPTPASRSHVVESPGLRLASQLTRSTFELVKA